MSKYLLKKQLLWIVLMSFVFFWRMSNIYGDMIGINKMETQTFSTCWNAKIWSSAETHFLGVLGWWEMTSGVRKTRTRNSWENNSAHRDLSKTIAYKAQRIADWMISLNKIMMSRVTSFGTGFNLCFSRCVFYCIPGCNDNQNVNPWCCFIGEVTVDQSWAHVAQDCEAPVPFGTGMLGPKRVTFENDCTPWTYSIDSSQRRNMVT